MTNRYVRDRILLPLVIPIAVLIGAGFFVVNLSRVLLAVNKNLSVVVAIAAAGIILIAATWAATRKRIARSTLVMLMAMLALVVGTGGAIAAKHGERAPEKVGAEPSQPPATRPPATQPPATQPPATQPPATQPPPASGAEVKAADFKFTPQTLTVTAGATVTWDMADGQPHTVSTSPGDPAAFDSGIKNPGEKFSFTFAKAGTYKYYCKLHGSPDGLGMAATVNVT
jgi:plastocyanin